MNNQNRSRRVGQAAGRLLLATLVMGHLGGCVSAPAGFGEQVYDPFEKVNRGIYAFNSGVDRVVLRPIARGYQFIAPSPVETGIHNFFVNLRAPVEAVNALLQGKPGAAATNAGRFLMNSTFGIGGLIDVASYNGIERQQEDFAQTLAVWGVPSGPYLMLPLTGPVSLRDLAGLGAETYGVPIYENGWSFDSSSARDKLLIVRIIDLRAGFIGPDKRVREAFDSYAFLRSAYGQRRDFLIFDGDPPEEEFDDEDFEDE